MPSSSGGGSHSGGVHFGGSSGFSGGGHHGSGNNGYSGPGMSRRPFPGGMCYVYFDRWHSPHYWYCREAPARPSIASTVLAALIVVVFAAFALWSLAGETLFFPVRADTTTYDDTVVLEDRTGLIQDTEALQAAMLSFTEQTGVAPGLEVVRDSEWKSSAKTLETYAYNEYLRMYNDEKHWLFVVSCPDDADGASSVDWSFEGIIGDDLGRTVCQEARDECTVAMQQALLRSTPDTMGKALCNAFTSFSSIVMKSRVDVESCVIGGVVLLIALGILLVLFTQYLRARNLYNHGQRVNGSTTTVKYCSSCRKAYTLDTVYCPTCGSLLTEQTVDPKA